MIAIRQSGYDQRYVFDLNTILLHRFFKNTNLVPTDNESSEFVIGNEYDDKVEFMKYVYALYIQGNIVQSDLPNDIPTLKKLRQSFRKHGIRHLEKAADKKLYMLTCASRKGYEGIMLTLLGVLVAKAVYDIFK